MSRTLHHGQIVDLHQSRVFPGEIEVTDGRIAAIRETNSNKTPGFLSPGLVDAHVHIESSMLAPAEFARIAVIHGTVGTVSDPHEIANVLGIEGVRVMQRLAEKTPCKIHFGIPSCVPATGFETAGATLGPAEVEELCRDPKLLYLSEMMNFPGVIQRDPAVLAKLEAARRHGKRIDGHAPGLRGDQLRAYVAAGIETDHECFQLDPQIPRGDARGRQSDLLRQVTSRFSMPPSFSSSRNSLSRSGPSTTRIITSASFADSAATKT